MLKNKLFWLFSVLVIFFFLLSYRLLETPMGLTADESAFGTNAALLSRTGYDENGVFMPLFVNSINKSDWRQPWSQYYITLFFKIFGISINNLRLSSVILILFSGYLLYRLMNSLLGWRYAILSMVLFFTTPIIFLQSHLGLDNIMPLPFVLIWLLNLNNYRLFPKPKFLIFAGLSLGASFYSYKGMRAVVPVWAILTFIYILYLNYRPKIKLIKLFSNTLPFVLTIIPFFIAIFPISQTYPGAIFGGARPKFTNLYDLLYAYLSHYDLTFLYTLPFFVFGFIHSLKLKKFWAFLILTYFSGPLLFGLVDSVHRASRIMAIIPAYIVICVLGTKFLLTKIKHGKYILCTITFLFAINFIDFTHYYWFSYPKFTENIFGNIERSVSYQVFSYESQKRNLKPYVDKEIYESFFDAVSFTSPSTLVPKDELPPTESIYLTYHDGDLEGFTKLNVAIPQFRIYINP
ncbi:MAG: Glycosyl transferase, family 39 [Microgenomates group bacterium GW2011_GWA2_40_6]|nr:MAG: Glycosyl transferase, family 39 [Microgenomates group bacterium GW2011_GWA2_40_6]